ncbi:ParB N-terminal domain-containing protein [Streptomyces sp. H27-C3]|uniref:ParB N-terminal domain-containing protein n=1 Tax=Streptomyces sp. H27-C3 TaxID=3046305 RepID=UPI0024B8984D|nr:ParB N-terminal domain-containing protein [Streptomyces sp. H27-C3]MDJ0463059.1 ParB N-terminal domain-containing protein [Streptomyces sp. H27-C3]
MDYPSWRATEARYEWHPEERTKMEELIESIRWEGLRAKVEIMARGTTLNVANGHHRIVALRNLGCTHVPYRWYRMDRQPLHREQTWYERAMLPAVRTGH